MKEIEDIVLSEDFQKFTNSKICDSLLKDIELNNKRWMEIPIQERILALYLIYTRNIKLIPSIESLVYKRRIPSIEEYLTDEYLPSDFQIIQDDNIWKKELISIYDQNSCVFEHILTGAIGIAKSSTAVVSHSYNLYRINSLRNPQYEMGSISSKPMNLQLMSLTKSKSSHTLLDQFKHILKCSKYYEKVKKPDEFVDYENSIVVPWCERKEESIDYIEFPNFIRIKPGSQDFHAIGEDIFGLLFDEAEFRKGASAEKTSLLYLQVMDRLKSRFSGRRYIMSTLCSSVKTDNGVIGTYIKSIPKGDKYTKISSYSIWDVKYSKQVRECENWFYVLRGTKTHPSKVLNKDEKELFEKNSFLTPTGCEVIKVPDIFDYKRSFLSNVQRALQDLAGIMVIGEERPFDDLENLEYNFLTPVFNISASLKNNDPLYLQFPISDLFEQSPIGYSLKRYPDTQRFLHVDLADTGICAITMCHKELNKENNKILYVIDFCVKIASPDRINLSSVLNLILDLKKKFNINIKKITADQYQSTYLLQELEKNNINCGRLSVDRDLIPYNNFASIIYERCLRIGTMGELKTQLSKIYYHNNKPFHLERKDMADSIVGSVFNATMDSTSQPINYFVEFDEKTIKEVFFDNFEMFNNKVKK